MIYSNQWWRKLLIWALSIFQVSLKISSHCFTDFKPFSGFSLSKGQSGFSQNKNISPACNYRSNNLNNNFQVGVYIYNKKCTLNIFTCRIPSSTSRSKYCIAIIVIIKQIAKEIDRNRKALYADPLIPQAPKSSKSYHHSLLLLGPRIWRYIQPISIYVTTEVKN